MIPIRSFIVLTLLLAPATYWNAVAADRKPNIVFMLADDLGQRDLGVYVRPGEAFYETPNLDRMAEQGARFTDAYAACPVCSPTRASILSGQWPQRTGVTDYIGAASPEKWDRNTILRPAQYADRLALETPTFAEALKGAGYATFFAGKWHLGPEGFWPENQGFDVNKGGNERGGPYGGNRYFSPYGNPRLPDGPPGEHLPDRLAAETATFIESNRETPFVAFLSFYSVHTPLMAREDLKQKYEHKRDRLGLGSRWGRELTRDVRLTQNHAVYAGMVEAMDLAVGKVLAKLDELDLAENTLVIFSSDNGGLSTSEGWPTSNHPLRAGKGWLYEGGTRVPLLARWPGVIEAGRVIRAPVSSPDFLPTLLEAAGVEPPPGLVADGMSLLPLLRGGASAERPLFWHYPHYGNQGGAPGAAIRRGQWKLIEWFEDRRVELFDLSRDLGEENDLSRTRPELVERLHGELRAWQQDVGAVFPSVNPRYDLAKPSGRVAARPVDAARSPAAMTADKPNVLLIFTDDHGWGDVSAYGSKDARTPNIDRLAEEGMLFSAMRANATVCSPSRAALLTGRYADRVGVPGVIRTDREDSWGYLDPKVPTLADELRRAGYHTALIGKWHLGLESPNVPNERGFDYFHGFLGDMMDSYTTHLRHGQNYMRWNGDMIDPVGHATDLFSDWAAAYLGERGRRKGEPFFLYLAYNAPHFPIEPPAAWLERVRERAPGIEPKRARNVALVEHLDDGIGRVLAALEQAGLKENTLVVFTADNGGSLPHAQSNGPWRDGKQSHYEGGLRVPFLARWPGHIQPGSRTDQNGLVFDLFPTFLELAGAAPAAELDAVSLVPVFRGRPLAAARDLYFVRREGGAAYGGKSYEALIRGEWKLLQNNPYSPLELYNLKDDPHERTDLAGARREVVNELGLALRRRIQAAGSSPWQAPDHGR